MNVAIIIATKNRSRDISVLLDSLRKQSTSIAEIAIVDSSDNDLTKDCIGNYKGEFQSLLYIPSLPGLPLQRNIGISNLQSNPDIVCFFDDDVELEQQYIEMIIQRYESDLSVVGISGNIMNERRRPFHDRLVRKFFFITDNTNGKLLPSGDAGHIFAPDRDTEVAVLSGCNMSYRSAIIFQSHLRFDQNLIDYAYMEDQDFSFRASRYGKLHQLSHAKLVHHISLASRPKYRQLYEMYIINSFYLLKKNHPPGIIQYLCYSWRIMGKLLDAITKSIIHHTLEPVIGWCFGIFNINMLSKKLI